MLTVLVHSTVVVAVAATAVAATTTLLIGWPVEALPLVVVFAVTVLVYGVNRLTDRREDRQNVPGRAAFVDQFGWLVAAIGAIGYLAVTAVAIVQGIPGAPLLLVVPLVPVVYSRANLKRYFLVKNLSVGVAWGLLPVGVGIYYGSVLTVEIGALVTFWTVMITVAAVVFDIKDVEGDKIEGIDTVPIRVGPATTRVLAATATALVAAGVAVAVLVGPLEEQFLLLIVLTGYVGAYVPFATTDRGPLLYGLVIDGEHIVLFACVSAWHVLVT